MCYKVEIHIYLTESQFRWFIAAILKAYISQKNIQLADLLPFE